MTLASVSEADKGNGSPKNGDMIAFNPNDAGQETGGLWRNIDRALGVITVKSMGLFGLVFGAKEKWKIIKIKVANPHNVRYGVCR